MTLRGSCCASIAFRSSSGRASAVDSVWASSDGETAPAAITDATKLVRFSLASSDEFFGGLGVQLAGVDQHPRHAGEARVRCFGKGIQQWSARSVMRKAGDHRRFTLRL